VQPRRPILVVPTLERDSAAVVEHRLVVDPERLAGTRARRVRHHADLANPLDQTWIGREPGGGPFVQETATTSVKHAQRETTSRRRVTGALAHDMAMISRFGSF
jgi:hypothetical protein